MRFIRRTALTAFMLMLSVSVFCLTPTITFNSSTGSDTAASGAGPATAKSGTAAATAASTLVTLVVDSPDLTGVATDGSAVLWVASSSGIQFSKITGYDNCTGVKTVTVATAYANTESGKNWGIGGKRATLDNANSRKLFTADLLPGWTASLDDNQTLNTSAINLGVSGDVTNGPITIKSTSSRVTINQTANAACFTNTGSITNWQFENLKLTNSNGTKTSARGVGSIAGGSLYFNNCIFGDVTNTLLNGLQRSGGNPAIIIDYCEFGYTTGACIAMGTASPIMVMLHSYLHNFGAGGYEGGTGTGGRHVLHNNIFANGTGDAVLLSSDVRALSIENNTIHNCTGDGIDMSAGITIAPNITNNNFTANGNYGIRAASGQTGSQTMVSNNNYGTGATANTSGNYLNLNAGANDLAVDPGYVNAAGGNFAVGASVRAKGFPLSSVGTIGAGQSSTYTYPDIGAAQSAGSDNGSVY